MNESVITYIYYISNIFDTFTHSLVPTFIHILFYINCILKAKFPLHLICSFLIEIKLPSRDTKGDYVEACSNEAVKCIILEAFGDISNKIVLVVIVFLQWQVFKECWSFTIEEHSHHQQLYQSPDADQQQAQ